MRKLLLLLVIITTPLYARNFTAQNQCAQGAIAASEAYNAEVYYTKKVNLAALADRYDFRVIQQPFPVDHDKGLDALAYIIKRLGEAGSDSVVEWELDWATREFIKKVCLKL